MSYTIRIRSCSLSLTRVFFSDQTHPIRHNAIYMKRKADHHLDFLVDAAASHEDPLAMLDAKHKNDEDDEDEDDSDEEALANKLSGNKLASSGLGAAKRGKDGQGGSSRKVHRVRSCIGSDLFFKHIDPAEEETDNVYAWLIL